MFKNIYIPKHSKIGLLLRAEAPHASFEDEEVKKEYIEAEIQEYTPIPFGKKKQLKQFRGQRSKILIPITDSDEPVEINLDRNNSFDTIEDFEKEYL